MILYIGEKVFNNEIEILNKVEYFDLNVDCLQKLLFHWASFRLFYYKIPENSINLFEKTDLVHEWIHASNFYTCEKHYEIIYKNLLLFGEENIEKILILWEDRDDFHTKDLRKNYKKYFKQGIIKSIIE